MDPLQLFSAATRTWFAATFAEPTKAQAQGWPAIASGGHTLIHAPTGSGKTLAAFLWAIDRLLHEPEPDKQARCRVLYVSPMKALAYDVERNLRAPLVGISHAATGDEGSGPTDLVIAMRTGDTPARDRQRMQRHPPDILITTPESLYLMLTSEARQMFGSVQTVILDEIHAVAGTKRGSHLALSMERLEELAKRSPQRIGLSATQRPLETIARFMGGGTLRGGEWTPREVTVVDAPGERPLDVELIVPVEDMASPAPPDPLATTSDESVNYRSIWPAIYPQILDLIRKHRSTIVFANSRRLAERICAEINMLAGEELARAHHGSVAREQRVVIEEQLKRGDLAAVVATSSLELGIDMGAVDLVVQVESPTSVASGLQRVGRSGHQVGGASVARVFPKFRGDLVEATVVVRRMLDGDIEETRIPVNALDVLAQHIVAAVSKDDWGVGELFDLVRRAAPYSSLGRKPFDAVLDMLSGRYPSDLFAELRPRLVWDRVADRLSARPGAQQIAVQNAGTIPDRGHYSVNLPDGVKVGELDEEMVYESRPGDTFILGASTWKISDITQDRVEVIPAPGEPAPRMPFWRGDTMGRPLETGLALGEFVRRIGRLDPDDAVDRLQRDYRLNELAARNIVQYLSEEQEATGVLPTDRTLVVERFRDEIGDWRLVLLSPLGARVHGPWAMALTHRFRGRYGHDVNAIWADDGIAFRFADADEPPSADDLYLDPDEVEELLMDHLGDTALFAGRFREAAARALLLPRRRPGKRTPLWMQRRRSADLLAAARQFGSFPIILETYREILQDDFDLPALGRVLTDIRARKINVREVELQAPSPFASSLLFDFVAAYLYEGDAPLAERRAAALTLDRELLREILGEGELRDLLSADVLTRIELELQRLVPDRAASGPDAIWDLLRELGPLDADGIEARSRVEDVATVLNSLEQDHRVIAIRMAAGPKWAAIEDAGRLRDGLGIQPPPGVPDAYLEAVSDPLGDVVARYARTHGPFSEDQAALDLGLPPAVLSSELRRLEEQGRVVSGAFRPEGSGPEWIDRRVLQRLKRLTLAQLRSEIEPVERESLGSFLPEWQGVGGSAAGSTDSLVQTLRQLQGAVVPASILERDVLAARMKYSPDLLDHVMVTGDVVWVGVSPLGRRDGRVSLFFRDQLPLLLETRSTERPDSEQHERLRKELASRGASFFRDLYGATGGGDPQPLVDSLWDLVWAGEVTNDSLAPLRGFQMGRASRSVRRRPGIVSNFPPSSSGRWSLVSDLVSGEVDPTRRATAMADQLLERHGVLTREGVLSEGTSGGYAGLYPVLAAMEESGRIRRGYFVEGLGGSQFALPGAVDRLRSPISDDRPHLLAAADPANPYGASLGWPEVQDGRPSRSAGAYVVLCGGALTVFLERGGRSVSTFTDDVETLAQAAAALTAAADRNRRLRIERVDGQPASETPLGRSLLDAGFVASFKGLVKR